MLFIVLLQDEVMSASLFPMAPAAYIDILKRSFLFFFFFFSIPCFVNTLF